MHMAIVHNCHSHVASVLNCVKSASIVPSWLHWNVVTIFLAQLFCASWIPSKGRCFRPWFLLWPAVASWHVFHQSTYCLAAALFVWVFWVIVESGWLSRRSTLA